MGQNVNVVALFKAKAGVDRKLKELLLTLIKPSRADEGCISYDLHQSIDDPALFAFYETWESRELLEKHSSMPHLQQFRSNAKDLLAEPAQVIVLAKLSN